MNVKQKDELKSIIEETISRLTEEVTALEEQCQPIAPDCSLGRLTRMEAIGEQKVSQEVLKQIEDRLQRLQYAQRRIDSSEYGLCLVCDDEIAFERLKLVPESTICITCANERN